MKIHRFFATALVTALLLTAGMPRFAAAVEPEEDTGAAETLPPPAENGVTQPAEFYIKLINGANGVKIEGYFSGYTPGMRDIQSFYSLDGEYYQPVMEGNWVFSDEILDGDTPKNTVASQNQSPLEEYLEKEIDTFYIRLHYQTDEGEKISQAAQFSRPTQMVPLPEGVQVVGVYPIATMRVGRASFQYNVTVKAGATAAAVAALLPETLPIDVQLIAPHGAVEVQRTQYSTQWSLPEVIAQEGAVVESAATVTPPEELVFESLNTLHLLEPPPMPPSLRLNLNVPDGPLYELHGDDEGLSLTFPFKPSGATGIIPSYSLDGGETWVETVDLLSYSEPIDAWPKNPDYRYVALFSSQQSPYKEYLAHELDGFLVRLDITGGTFDEQSEAVAWPMDYEYEPPNKDNGDNGSGGNGGNIGSDNSSGNSGSNGGQRPGLPEDSEAEATPSPTPEPEPVPEPIPEPVPEQTPEPVPEPIAEPEPTPTPEPQPPVQPISEPSTPPLPTPAATPEQPVIAPISTPTPEPSAPLPATPSPEPEPSATNPAEPSATPVVTAHSVAEEKQPKRQSIAPVAAVALTLTAGGGIAVCVGASSMGTGVTSGFSRLAAKIKRFFIK